MDIICFGQQNWDYCWTGKQQLMSRLAARGHRVLYVDPTWAGIGDLVGANGGLRHEGPGELHVLTYGYRPLLRWRGNRWWWPRAIRRTAGGLGFEDPVAIALRPPARELMAALDPRGRVYYAVDEMTAFGDRSEAEKRAIRLDEEAMLGTVDIAIGVSRRLADRFATLHPRSVFLPNGADVEHFAPGSLDAATPHPGIEPSSGDSTLVFVGQVDERLDQALLLRLVTELPGVRVILAGRVKAGVDVSALEAESGIQLLGYVPYEELPAVLTVADVCLVPYEVNELTRSCNPLKVFEYLATGRPVVATDLDGLEWCRDVITIAGGADGFVAGVRRALAEPGTGREERLERARSNGWDARVDELEGMLGEARRIDGKRRSERDRPVDPRYRGESFGPLMSAVFIASRAAGRMLSWGRSARFLLAGRRRGVRRILVARRTRLGDMVVCLPMLRALRARYPDARIELAVQPGAEAMATRLLGGTGEGSPVDAVEAFDFLAEPTRLGRLRGAARLLLRGTDLLLTGAAYAVMRESLLCGAPSWIALEDGHPLQSLAPRRLPHDPARHEAANHVALAEAVGAVAAGPDRNPRVVPAGAEARRAIRRELDIPEHAEMVVVHPGAQKPSRRWPADRFAAVARDLLAGEADRWVALTGGPDEAGLGEAVRRGVDESQRARVVSAAGRTNLEQLIALLSGASLVIVGDTGVLHLARALGCPLLAVLGPENELRWGPAPGGPAPAASLRYEVPCAPCKKWDCEPHFCLAGLTSGEVTAAAREYLREGAFTAAEPVTFEPWARGHFPSAGTGREEIGDVAVWALDRRTSDVTWPALPVAAPPPPRIGILPAHAGSTVRAGETPGYPADRLHVVTREEPLAGPTTFAVAVVTDGPAWTNGRLSGDVATLVRRPDLAVAAAGRPDRGPGDPVSPAAVLAGVTFRASVLADVLEGRSESADVNSAEYAVVRAAWQAVARRRR